MTHTSLFRSSWLATVLSAAVAVAYSADWPQWLGPTRNSVTPEVVAPWGADNAPQVVWRHPIVASYSSPVVADGVVYVHTTESGKEGEQVLALAAQTGNQLWSDVYPRDRFRSMFGAGPRTTPSLADGKLFTYGITGILCCYDAKAGKRLWQCNPYETLKGTMPRFGVCSSPVIVDGRVIVMVGGGGSAVAAYDAATGDLAWKAFDEPASSASPIVMVRTEGNEKQTDVVVQTTLRVMGLSPKDGSLRWEHPMVFQPAGVSPTPLVVGKSLVCTTMDTGTMAIEFAETAGVKPKSPWWKQDACSYFSTGTTGPKDSVLVVTNVLQPLPRTDVTCFDLAKGEQLWKQEKIGYYHVGLITTGDGKLLMLDDAGNLILAEVTRDGYKQLSKSQICRGTLSSPALANGRLYARDDKELVCIELNRKS